MDPRRCSSARAGSEGASICYGSRGSRAAHLHRPPPGGQGATPSSFCTDTRVEPTAAKASAPPPAVVQPSRATICPRLLPRGHHRGTPSLRRGRACACARLHTLCTRHRDRLRTRVHTRVTPHLYCKPHMACRGRQGHGRPCHARDGSLSLTLPSGPPFSTRMHSCIQHARPTIWRFGGAWVFRHILLTERHAAACTYSVDC